MIVILIVGFVFLAIFDLNTLLKGKDKKTLILYFTLFILGFGIHLLLVIDKAPISPAVMIERIIKLIV